MDTTTADTEDDVNTVVGFTTLAELNGAGYVRQTMGTFGITEDAGNNRAELTAANVTFTAVSAGASPVQGALIIKWITDLNSSMPIAWIDTGGFPFTPGGGNIVVTWNAEGVIQFT